MDDAVENNSQRIVVEEEEDTTVPLLLNHNASSSSATPCKTKATKKKAIKMTFKGTAQLTKMLPTGSVLIFEFFSPLLTHQGSCNAGAGSLVNRLLTASLLLFCLASSFAIRFTDSFRDEKGKIRYGFVTAKGLWVADGSGAALPPEEAAKRRLRFRDVFHGVLSVLVFGAVAMFNQNVVSCFFPMPSEETRQTLMAVPTVVGMVCSMLFVMFPSTRHATLSKKKRLEEGRG